MNMTVDVIGPAISTHTFHQAFGSPWRLTQCLRFGYWLTLFTLNIHLLSFLLTYLNYSVCQWRQKQDDDESRTAIGSKFKAAGPDS